MSVLLSLVAALTIAAPAPSLVRDLNQTPDGAGGTAAALRDRGENATLDWDPWLAALPGGVLFEAAGGDGVTRVWSSDGSAVGTMPLAAVDTHDPLRAGDQLFFLIRSDGHSPSLWRSDGTPSGTGPVVLPIVPDTYPEPLGALGNRLLLGNSYGAGFHQLWITDGTAAGSGPLESLLAEPFSSPEDMVILEGRAVFTAGNATLGRELWTTDGTPEGTELVADLTPGSGSTFVIGGAQLLHVGSRVLFPAAGALWRTDGTAAGTAMVADIDANRFTTAFIAADRLFFQPDAAPPALWASDGSTAAPIAAGVHMPKRLGSVAGTALFLASDGGGEALWASNGTAAGTVRLRALRADRTHAVTAACLPDACVFAADDGAHGSEPWRSDGSAGGTALLADLQPGDGGSHPYGFAVADGHAVFLADDGVHGIEPWVSNGAPGHARLLADIAPGAASSSPGVRDEVAPLLVARGAVFLGADDGVHGREVWTIPLATVAPAGDCNDDGVVAIDELVRAVAIALGAQLATCPAADANGDGAVAIDELIAAVTAAL